MHHTNRTDSIGALARHMLNYKYSSFYKKNNQLRSQVLELMSRTQQCKLADFLSQRAESYTANSCTDPLSKFYSHQNMLLDISRDD